MKGFDSRTSGVRRLRPRSKDMSEQHDFTNTVVAILDERPIAGDAIEMLSSADYDFEVLVGEEGRRHIDPRSGDGWTGKLKSLLTAFADQQRIIERLDEALQRGKTVVSIDVTDTEPEEAIEVLKDHGGHYIWRLGEWTFTPIED